MATPAIFFSDLHLHDYKAYAHLRDRLEDCLKVIDDVYTLARKKGAKVILFGGDMFDMPKFLPTKAVNRLMARLSKWITECPDIVWYAITGNHDFATKNLPDKPAETSLSHLATAFPLNFIILDNTGEIFEGAKVRICGIPNYEFREHFNQALSLAHDAVINDKARGIKVTLIIHQLPRRYNTPAFAQTDCDPSDPLFEPFDLILCGDDHVPGNCSPKFVVGGNPLHKDKSDAGQEKGIWSLDLEEPATTLKFHSRKGRYPEFRILRQGEAVDSTEDFIIQVPEPQVNVEGNGVADITKFGNAVPHTEVITNYWKQEDGKDTGLLAMGLTFVQ